MKSLVSKIFTTFVTILLLVQIVSFGFAYHANSRLEGLKLSNQISTAETVFKNQFETRNYYLQAFSSTAAKDYGLKQVFNEDTKSFLVALNNHRQRIDADIAVAIFQAVTDRRSASSDRKRGRNKNSCWSASGKTVPPFRVARYTRAILHLSS